MKYILIIGDGMADNPVPELGGLTPLQYADIPNINSLALRGEVGSVRNVPEGLPPGSDTAILSIFGCDPRTGYSGRAPLEAAASGIRLSPGDVAYRCNMVSYEEGDMPFEEKRILSHSAGSLEGEISDELVTELFSEPSFREAAEKAGMRVYPGNSFRHIAVQSQPDIDGLLLIPPHDHLGEKIGPIMPSGGNNAGVLRGLMERAHAILEEHPINKRLISEGKLPANGIWFWAEGTASALPDFVEHYGREGSVISAVPLCQGIAVLTGLNKVLVEGATGELETNYEGKADAAVEELEKYDFAALHVEAPDECTHNGDLKGKLQAIENIDKRVVKHMLTALKNKGWDYRILILSDHKTLISTRGHDGDPVPYLFYDSRRDSGAGYTYCEESGAAGRYIDVGTKLMDMLFSK